MNIQKAYPSTYMKAADLDGEDLVVTIAGLQVEAINGEDKPILYFQETEKGLVLNKTNATTISSLLQTAETDDWAGQKIALMVSVVDFQGKQVEAIRVKPRRPASANAATGSAPNFNPRGSAAQTPGGGFNRGRQAQVEDDLPI